MMLFCSRTVLNRTISLCHLHFMDKSDTGNLLNLLASTCSQSYWNRLGSSITAHLESPHMLLLEESTGKQHTKGVQQQQHRHDRMPQWGSSPFSFMSEFHL